MGLLKPGSERMRTVRFGVIGCGLMGQEFASATARWSHLADPAARPEIVALCDTDAGRFEWYRRAGHPIAQCTSDYRQILANPEVEAVYCAVPHHLHRQIYCEAIESGKHLLGEKPFGIDMAACRAILDSMARQPCAFVRCSSEFPFYPAMQRAGAMIESGALGRILEANAGFFHSSDLDPQKPINWKRQIEFNGEYGCMGDLGMHVCHAPFRAGWRPLNVRAILSNIVTRRPDGKGGTAPCDTWDNATLLCETLDPASRATFPMTLRMQRIAPGEMNTWSFEAKGDRACVRFSTRSPQALSLLEYKDGRQDWAEAMQGYRAVFPTITGTIFEFGFCDAILQMWAGYLHELVHGRPRTRFSGTATPEEAALSHRLFTAALESQRTGATVEV